ncbi:MAG: hypothetical protein HDT28_01915 [Clostridiales bacterium]|nr:hypothetical protein [Clostridiales bacterium]
MIRRRVALLVSAAVLVSVSRHGAPSSFLRRRGCFAHPVTLRRFGRRGRLITFDGAAC